LPLGSQVAREAPGDRSLKAMVCPGSSVSASEKKFVGRGPSANFIFGVSHPMSTAAEGVV